MNEWIKGPEYEKKVQEKENFLAVENKPKIRYLEERKKRGKNRGRYPAAST